MVPPYHAPTPRDIGLSEYGTSLWKCRPIPRPVITEAVRPHLLGLVPSRGHPFGVATWGPCSAHHPALHPSTAALWSRIRGVPTLPLEVCARLRGAQTQAMTKSATMTYCTYDLNRAPPANSTRRVPKNAGCTTVQFFYQGVSPRLTARSW